MQKIKKDINIEKSDTGYIVKDKTIAYVIGVVEEFNCWTSHWNDKFELVKMIYQYSYGNEYDYTNLDKTNRDYYRTKLAISRHKKGLLEYCGISKRKDKPKMKKFIWCYKGINNLYIHDMVETPGMLNDKRKKSINYAEATEENLKLAREYNELYEKINKIRAKLFFNK